ncbi:SDR family mycofactocin-dependent oxidoreductase [Williamsia limnetica]|uniref:SDR family mycofactocin-dependent oxidoreductase n=1 Tax=Williamsia limnetica TaxID=882452 RepID=A0A318RF83_WILLI|nr:mycofactocin-coupled SDR family oxidoreductase [Williamsia limnetica]PYE12459.1 SDR family mycofactocin-dependent oxidoreductase [Williamsia limnetica]
MGRLENKVAFVSGAARGQGRSHAIRLAEEGADIIAVDICDQLETVGYPMGTEADLEETASLVEALDRRIIAVKADVRDDEHLKQVVADGVAELGHLDIVVANAGISGYGPVQSLSRENWQQMLDVNLTGVWNTCKVAVPHLQKQGGGSITITSSAAGLHAIGGLAHYVSAKHGLVGLMRAMALELGPDMIRVNSIHPTQVNTPMLMNDYVYKLFAPDVENPTVDDIKGPSMAMHTMPVAWVEPVDISNAIVFLASDEGRYITGVPLPVDLGADIKG